MKQIWDISPLISPDGPVFPGDAPYSVKWTSRYSRESPFNLCSISLSPHIGAHADAPLHMAEGAPDISGLDLHPFIGKCRVIHAMDCGPLIFPKHLWHTLAPLPERILIRSRASAPKVWASDFTAVSPETIVWLHEQNVRLIGIDTPSIDPADSKTLPSHNKLYELDMRVLENLVLDEIPENDYELIALPLKLAGACASPVRAILIPHF